jgi:lysozyme
MTPGQNAISLVKEFEGCKLTAYPDPISGGDPWTIGYGFTGPNVRRGLIWTQDQADAQLVQTLNHFASIISPMIKCATQNQFDAMLSFAYNLGPGNLQHSTLLKYHNAGDFANAKAQFLAWDKAGGEIVPGLLRRRQAEACVYGGANL